MVTKYWETLMSMKVELVHSDNISELDSLINSCIQNRKVHDIKITSEIFPNGKIQYVALIMLLK